MDIDLAVGMLVQAFDKQDDEGTYHVKHISPCSIILGAIGDTRKRIESDFFKVKELIPMPELMRESTLESFSEIHADLEWFTEYRVKVLSRTLAYVTANSTKNRRCNRCGSVVLVETEEMEDGYPYQCVHCDENFFAIETTLGDEHDHNEFMDLCCMALNLGLDEQTPFITLRDCTDGINTKDSLTEINTVRISVHGAITDIHVELANAYATKIKADRDNCRPVEGDILRYTNEVATYFPHAHVGETNSDGCTICEVPHIPFVSENKETGKLSFSAGGGEWGLINPMTAKLVGKETRMFNIWCSDGVQYAHSGLAFMAEVNVWEYTPENLPHGDYTTKNWNRRYYHISNEDGKTTYHSFMAGCALSKSEYLAWLKTYKGVEFAGHSPEQVVVYYYRAAEYLLEKNEWDDLPLPVGTRPNGMGGLYIKYKYDDDNHIVHEYRYTNASDSKIMPYTFVR